jgi:2-polyprenyl-3-methyl-5-hydroxy-6-metoxy-1,4-benzoquinol methylase
MTASSDSHRPPEQTKTDQSAIVPGIAPPGVYDIIRAEIGSLRGLRLLDIPCGSGVFAGQLAAGGALTVAADLVGPIRHSPAVFADMNTFVPFRDKTFHIVTCVEGIEHIENPYHLAREFFRILRPGGRLLLSTPNIHNLRSRLKFLLRGTFFWFDVTEITHIGHITLMPYFLLAYALERAGFHDIAVRANRPIRPAVPPLFARWMQTRLSKPFERERALNAPALLSGEGLIVTARKL